MAKSPAGYCKCALSLSEVPLCGFYATYRALLQLPYHVATHAAEDVAPKGNCRVNHRYLWPSPQIDRNRSRTHVEYAVSGRRS
jgi:hypothetical protein